MKGRRRKTGVGRSLTHKTVGECAGVECYNLSALCLVLLMGDVSRGSVARRWRREPRHALVRRMWDGIF